LRQQGEDFLIRKIFLTGIIFFLFSTGLSQVEAQTNFDFYIPMEEQLPLQEWEPFTLQERPVSSPEKSSSSPATYGERSSAEKLEPPIPDGYDDFVLEILLKDRHKKEFDFDIPIVINARVEEFIEYFQTIRRDRFVIWLARSGKYIPLMKSLLREHGLPEDLVYMAFIESGFDPHAYSRSKASGPWQFISLTGKRYGLRVNWWVDERRDPEKSTIAAAKYLKDLYERFACWHLAAAGYNAGEYKIIKAMRRYRTEDFWKLTKYQYLRRETKDYVPLMMAAALVAKDPERYGFTDVEHQKPLRYEKVKVTEVTALSLIARACEASLEEIKDLNPELQRGVTPPNVIEYEIKIPFGKKNLFLKNFEALKPLEQCPFRTHLVKSGETLQGITKSYRVKLEPLLEVNHLKKTSRISKGMTLLIPLSKDEEIKPLTVVKKKNGRV
jgi:membrane-bound lytic murein transglycosylase D